MTATVSDDVANYLNNKKRRELSKLEDDGKMIVQILSKEGVSPEFLTIECFDGGGREMKFLSS